MAAYNVTSGLANLTSSKNIFDIIVFANNAVDKILTTSMMAAVFVIMLLVLKRWGFDNALLSSSFSCFALSLILSYINLLNMRVPLIFFIIMAGTITYMIITER